MGKHKKQKQRRFNFSTTRIVPISVITDRFEPEPGLQYEDVPEELYARVTEHLFFQEMEHFKHLPIGHGSMRKYVYGEARKHCLQAAYTVVVKSERGFEHTYLTSEQARTGLGEVVESGLLKFKEIDASVWKG